MQLYLPGMKEMAERKGCLAQNEMKDLIFKFYIAFSKDK